MTRTKRVLMVDAITLKKGYSCSCVMCSILGELIECVEDIFGEPRVHMPIVLPTHPTLCQDLDFTLSTDFSRYDLVVSFPSEIETDFRPGNIFEDYPDYEDSRARGFVQRSLDLHSFACCFLCCVIPHHP
ncbi:hypothetical protein Tco_0845061 [Tanacetum coccineum]